METFSQFAPAITGITWAMILFTWFVQWRTWRAYRRNTQVRDRVYMMQNDMLDSYLAVCMKVAEAPIRQSEADPELWSIDIEPDLLAWIQSIDKTARARGATVVQVPRDAT